MGDGADVRCARRLFQTLAAETGKTPEVVTWNNQYPNCWSDVDDRSLIRDGTSATRVK